MTIALVIAVAMAFHIARGETPRFQTARFPRREPGLNEDFASLCLPRRA